MSMVQPRKTHPDWKIVDWDVKNQINKQNF